MTLKEPFLRYYCNKDKKWVNLLNGCKMCECYGDLKLVGHGKHKHVKCRYGVVQ